MKTFSVIFTIVVVLVLISAGTRAQPVDAEIILEAGVAYTLGDIEKAVGSNETFDYDGSTECFSGDKSKGGTQTATCKRDLVIKGTLMIGAGETLKMDAGKNIRVDQGGTLKVIGTQDAWATITSIDGTGYTFLVDARKGGFEMKYAKLAHCGQGPLLNGQPTRACGLWILGNNIIIEHCVFTRNYIGLIVQGNNAIIRHNKFFGNTSYGLALRDGKNATVEKNEFYDNGNAILLHTTASSRIINNHIDNSNGINLMWKASDNTLSSNVVINAMRNAFQIRSYCTNNLFENNKVFASGTGCWLGGGAEANVIKSCSFNKCNTGVYFYGSRGNKLVNCKIINSSRADIQFGNDAHNECVNTEFDTLKKLDALSTLDLK